MMERLWREKREGLVSLAVLLVVIIALLALFLAPVSYHAERYRAELRKDKRILQELRAIEAVRGELGEVRQYYEAAELDSLVYLDVTPAEVSLDIQRRLSDWLANAQIQRTTPIEGRARDGYVEVGVQVQFSATLEVLLETLGAIELSSPRLVVASLRLSPVRQRARNQEQVQMLSVQMTVQTVLPVPGGEQ